MDRPTFSLTLRRAIADALSEHLRAAPEETPCAFAVILGQFGNSLGYAIATEEGLVRVADDYFTKGSRCQRREWEAFDDRQRLAEWLRWVNPDDGWHYGSFAEGHGISGRWPSWSRPGPSARTPMESARRASTPSGQTCSGRRSRRVDRSSSASRPARTGVTSSGRRPGRMPSSTSGDSETKPVGAKSFPPTSRRIAQGPLDLTFVPGPIPLAEDERSWRPILTLIRRGRVSRSRPGRRRGPGPSPRARCRARGGRGR